MNTVQAIVRPAPMEKSAAYEMPPANSAPLAEL